MPGDATIYEIWRPKMGMISWPDDNGARGGRRITTSPVEITDIGTRLLMPTGAVPPELWQRRAVTPVPLVGTLKGQPFTLVAIVSY